MKQFLQRQSEMAKKNYTAATGPRVLKTARMSEPSAPEMADRRGRVTPSDMLDE